MKEIYLHGSLGAHFGERFSLEVRDPAEAVRALAVQLPGFRAAIEASSWHVIRGPLDDGEGLDEDGLALALGSQNEIHITPSLQGAGETFNIIAGVALIAASFFIPGAGALGYGVITSGAVAGLGTSLALSGITQALASTPGADYNERESPAQRPSFLFDGPVNTSTQGLPVPVIYGRVRVGSVVISAGMTAEELDE